MKRPLMAAADDSANRSVPPSLVLRLAHSGEGRPGRDERRPIRTLVLSEVRLHREALASQLAAEPWIELVGAATAMSDAVRLAAEAAVDVVLLDLPPNRSSLAALGGATTALPGVRFVVLGVVGSDEDV